MIETIVKNPQFNKIENHKEISKFLGKYDLHKLILGDKEN